MKCPRCQYQSEYGTVRCPRCEAPFEAVDLEKLAHLRFLRKRLEGWSAEGLLPVEVADALLRKVEREARELEVALGVAPSAAPGASPFSGPAFPPVSESPPALGLEGAEDDFAVAAPHPGKAAAGRKPVLSWIGRTLASWLDGGGEQLRARGEVLPSVGTDSSAAVSLGREVAASVGPRFSWRQVGTYLLSERTLHALLALGTFLVLASGVVISTLNPTGLDPLPHLGVVAVTTAVFYGVGYLVRQKLVLVNTGETLLAIGGAFLPLNVFTLGQEKLLNWEPAGLWLAASLLCLPAYLAFHARLRDRIFAALTALAGGSELLALLNWLGAPLEWGLGALVGLDLGYAALAGRLSDGWKMLGSALFWVARVATPLVMALLLLGKLYPALWQASTGRAGGGPSDYAVGGAWWLGVAFYALSARLFQEGRYRAVAAWTLPVAFLLTLAKMPWDVGWYNLCLALLAGGYLVYGHHSSPITTLREPVYQVAFLLTLLAAFWPLATAASQPPTLLAVSVVYGAAAFLLKQRVWAYLSVYLLLPAYGLALRQLGLNADVLPPAWIGISAALLAAAEFAVRRSGEARRSLLETTIGLGAWRSRFASPLFSSGYATSVAALALCLTRYWSAPTLPGARDLPPTAILGLLSVVALYGLSAPARRTSLFLYPAAWLLPMAFTSAAAQAVLRLGLPLTEAGMARLLAVLGLGYLLVGLVVDRSRGHYAKPIYLVGYALTLAAMVLSALDRSINVQVVGLSLVAYGCSAWLVHRGPHPSYLWVVRRLFGEPASATYRTARALFLYLGSWLFPAWLLLAMSLWQPTPQVAHYGIALALLAPLYVALGLRFRLVDLDYRLPWYVAGYALAVAGPLVATADPTLRIAALAISVGLYLASAVLFRRSAWLYLVSLLAPLLSLQSLERLGAPDRYYGLALIVLALAYFLGGVALHHGHARWVLRPIGRTVGAYAMPFFSVGYLLAALGLGHAANQEKWIVVVGFLVGAAGYAGSGFAFRQSLFVHPVSWSLAVAYVVGMALTPLEPRYYGLGLLPGIGGYLALAEVLRRRLDEKEEDARDLGTPQTPPGPLGPPQTPDTPWTRFGTRRGAAPWTRAVVAWSTPFYSVLYAGTTAVVYYSWDGRDTLALAWWSFAAVYAVSTALFRRPGWLYPTVGGVVAAYLATLRFFVETPPSFANAMVALIVPASALLLLSHGVARFQPYPQGASRWSLIGGSRVWSRPWAAPLLLSGAVVLAISTAGSIPNPEAGFRTGLAYCVLATVLALLWRGEGEAWASMALAGLVLQEWMRLAGIPFAEQSPRWALAALALALLAIVVKHVRVQRIGLWRRPMQLSSAGVAVAALAAAGGHYLLARDHSLQTLAATTAVSGLTLVAHGFDVRRRLLVYLGVAFLEGGYMLQLLYFDVGQPQAFALPAGIYLLVVGYLEWRRGTGGSVKAVLESAALVLLLGISLIQAVGFLAAGHDRYVYDSFLFLESLALLGLGAVLRWKRSFFGATAALVADVFILLADPIRAMNSWYLLAATGSIMIGLVVLAEQRRQQIPLWVDEWRHRLEDWD